MSIYGLKKTDGSYIDDFGNKCHDLVYREDSEVAVMCDGQKICAEKHDNVNHPQHYHPGKYETIDVIDAWNLGFCLGNAVKYISRAGHKGDAVEDLKKAVWYIQREIENREKVDE